MSGLRFRTWLAPSVPLAYFEQLTTWLGRQLGVETTLTADETQSGPTEGLADPLRVLGVDVGYMCAPNFRRLARRGEAQLIGAAPVYDDPRTGGRPVYFSDVVVRRDAPFRQVDELCDQRWAYNDPVSLSGYIAPSQVWGTPTLVRSGSHLASLELIRSGEVDAAGIDSVALLQAPEDDLRVLHALGPFPIPPLVCAPTMQPAVREAIAAALLTAGDRFRAFGVVCFAAVSAEDYDLRTIC